MSVNSFDKLKKYFDNNQFPEIEKHPQGIRFLKLRSMSRKEPIEEFCTLYDININGKKTTQLFREVFNNDSIDENQIDNYIRRKFKDERAIRKVDEEYLIDQLSRLQFFDWGGSYGNSLEKNIVNNYVKKIKSFNTINEEIEGNLLHSLRGYTLNSWYNHWTSILIEDIFKSNSSVLPTIGLIKKIDFFINDIPFDLKVTYFPEQFMKEKLKETNYGVELTKIKKVCKALNIFIPTDLKDGELKLHLQTKLKECQEDVAREFLADLKQKKVDIISNAIKYPDELKIWLYENQGEMRFDASNRFFLILINESDLSESWKLKRNIPFLKSKINSHLSKLSRNVEQLDTQFKWKDTLYECKSDVLFITYSENSISE